MNRTAISCRLPLEELHQVLEAPQVLAVWATRYGTRYLAAWLCTDHIGRSPGAALAARLPIEVVPPWPAFRKLDEGPALAGRVAGATLSRSLGSVLQLAR